MVIVIVSPIRYDGLSVPTVTSRGANVGETVKVAEPELETLVMVSVAVTVIV
jgi:hypothetical protein